METFPKFYYTIAFTESKWALTNYAVLGVKMNINLKTQKKTVQTLNHSHFNHAKAGRSCKCQQEKQL